MRTSPEGTVYNRFCIISCIFILLFVFNYAKAQDVPHIISYQGQIASSDGKAMTGTHKITATLYSDRLGKNMVWQGSYDADMQNGIYNILLGSGAYKLPDVSSIDRLLWLGIKIDNGEEMQPRAQFASAPYALNVADKSITYDKLSDELKLMLIGNTNISPLAYGVNWSLDGNAPGAGSPVLGTTNNKNWDVITNNFRTIRFQASTADSVWNDIIGGYSGNTITDGDHGGSNVIAGGGFWVNYNSANEIFHSDVAVIGGGARNKIGDTNNVVTSYLSQTIAGGGKNWAEKSYTSVGGGHCNEAREEFSAIGGGDSNMIHSQHAAISGGQGNMVGTSATYGFIGGGKDNMDTAQSGVIGGGEDNTVDGTFSTIAGGENNHLSGTHSAIPGGKILTLGDYSFGFNAGTVPMDLSPQDHLAVFNDVDLLLGNTNSVARQLKFFSPSSSSTLGGTYTAFKAQGQNSVTFIYTLPDTIAGKGAILFAKNNPTGTFSPLSNTLDWIQAGSNGQVLTMNGGVPVWADTGASGVPRLKWYSESLATPVHSPAAVDTGAVVHGESVYSSGKWTSIGGGTLDSIYSGADNSGIGSGKNNAIDSNSAYAFIGGGLRNLIQTHLYIVLDPFSEGGIDTIFPAESYSFLGGGHDNKILAPLNVICGGDSNTIDFDQYTAFNSFIGGGHHNTIDPGSPYNAIVGGSYNHQGGAVSFIGGGDFNHIGDYASWSSIVGGDSNFVGDPFHHYPDNVNRIYYSFLGGGQFDTLGSSWSALVGGFQNYIGINSEYSFVGSGYKNRIDTGSSYSNLVGGYQNRIGTNSGYSFLGSGQYNAVLSKWSAIGSGFGNHIEANSDYSFLGSGYLNRIDTNSAYSTLSGGFKDTIYGKYGVIAGGDSNAIRSRVAGHGTSDYCTIGGGKDNFVNENNNDSAAYVPPQYTTIPGGRDNCVYGHYSIAMGWHNRVDGAYGTAIGQHLLAADYQTVIGRANISGTMGLNNWKSPDLLPKPGGQTLPNGNDWTFIIGNGKVYTLGNADSASNAFMVSDNGHSMVTHVNGNDVLVGPIGQHPALLGGTFSDNVLLAAADVDPLAAGGLTMHSNFGVTTVSGGAGGVYTITIDVRDPISFNPVIITNAWITASIVDTSVSDTILATSGGIVTVSPMKTIGGIPNRFIVKTYNCSCGALTPKRFMFHVFGRK